MRKVTRRIGTAFLEGRADKKGNTATDGHSLSLFGNRIAWKGNTIRTWDGQERPTYVLTLAEHDTVTTRERLNGLLELMGSDWRVRRENRSPYLCHPADPVSIDLLSTSLITVNPDGEVMVKHTYKRPAWT